MMKNIYHELKDKFQTKYNKAYIWLAQRLPLQNKVVFCNCFGKGFAGEPKYIALAMLRQKTKARLYWMTTDMDIDLPEGITPVLFASNEARWHLHTAKVWVYNYKNDFKVRKRKGQYYVQTWHGAFPMKKAEQEVERSLPLRYRLATKIDSTMIDLMYANSEYLAEIFRTKFWYNGEVIRSGSPRLSVLLHTPPTLREKIYSLYGIPKECKVLLYEPTFRNVFNPELFQFDYERVLSALSKRFGGTFVLLIRLHPNNARWAKAMDFTDAIDVTSYPDNDELMAIADVLISDYSSASFEFSLKRLPVFLFAKDQEQYLSTERGLYFSIDEFPFSMATDEDALCQNIMDFDNALYIENLESHFKRIGLDEDGNGGDNIVSVIKQRSGLR